MRGVTRRRFHAGAFLRSLRAHTRLDQRELARRAGVPHRTLARLEADEVDPRLSTVLRLVSGASCVVAVYDTSGVLVAPWDWEGALDRGERHFPAHLDIREVHDLRDWWAEWHYSTWIHPPLPTHTYDARRPDRRP